MDLLRASVIDLGSNTAKLVNYKVSPDSNYKHYQDESIRTKLGEELSQTGFLSDEAMVRAITALKRFRETVDFQSIKHVLPIATSAVREAANNISFLHDVYRETGFRFRILTEKEEALYSYFGAARSLKIPSMLFFDLGGGSLEIVYAKNFEIKRIMSLPLGALRLTQMFVDKSDGTYSSKGIQKLRQRILDLIPSREELGMDDDDDAILVGVGGTLRNIAKFHQANTDYPLMKVHNYSMETSSINRISAKFQAMKPERIAKIESINSGRSETITAGACTINLLMEQLGFDKITVSAQALREGTLGVSLEFYKEFSECKQITEEQIEQSIRTASKPDVLPNYLNNLIGILSSGSKITDSSPTIMSHTLKYLPETLSFRNLTNLLHFTLDDDSDLTHREQIISALSIITYRKKKMGDQIFKNFESVLKSDDKKTIKKISSLLVLAEIIEKTNATVSVQKLLDSILFEVKASSTFPEILFRDAIKKIATTFDVMTDYQILDESGNIRKEKLRI